MKEYLCPNCKSDRIVRISNVTIYYDMKTGKERNRSEDDYTSSEFHCEKCDSYFSFNDLEQKE